MSKSDYERVNDIQWWKKVLLLLSTLITIILTLEEKYQISQSNPDLKDYVDTVIGLNSILILVYVALEFKGNYIFTKAEKVRRLQYLDNSFGSNFAGLRLKNYFSQENLSPGFYKLAVNCFENTFHTLNILRHMQVPIYRNACLVGLVFIFSAAVGDKGTVRALIEAILPLAVVQEAVKTFLFINKLDTLLDSFKSFFNSLKSANFTDREPEAMKQIIDYETTLAWASCPLDSKIFMKHKDELANEWDELKVEYNIQTDEFK